MRYVLTSDWIPTPTHFDAEAALHEWMRRFITSHGPVTIDDAARWTGLPKTPVRKAVAAAVDAGEVVHSTIGDIDYVHAPDLEDLLSDWEANAQETVLLPGFDEMILGYKDRSATLEPANEKLVVPGGNGMFKNTVLTGTKAVGTWKRSSRKTGPRVIFEAFSGATIDSDAVEAAAANHPSFE